MILYFTGTGNSRHIAKKLSDMLEMSLVDLNEKIKSHDKSPINSDEKLVVVAPTYAWRMPLCVEDVIKNTEIVGAKSVWFVMDCGGDIGDADRYNRTLAKEKGLVHMGTYEVKMPDNYIAMYDVPNEEQSRKIIESADRKLGDTVSFIKSGKAFPDRKSNAYGKMMSNIVNPVFYKFFVKAKAFHSGDKCNGCGKCVKLCPLNNISLKDGKPVWSDNCTHCMACICHCPTQAIEYGKKTVGRRRYYCE